MVETLYTILALVQSKNPSNQSINESINQSIKQAKNNQ